MQIERYTCHTYCHANCHAFTAAPHKPMTGTSGIILADEDGITERGQWAGVARVLGPPWARLPSLTVGLLGVQVLWSVEMSYGALRCYTFVPVHSCRLPASPYLVSLGLSKSGMAAVFLAGPLSGLIVQPLIGLQQLVKVAHVWGCSVFSRSSCGQLKITLWTTTTSYSCRCCPM